MSDLDLVLHVGLQQSGGGVLDRALSRLRPQLRRAGLAYVGSTAIESLTSADGWLANDALSGTGDRGQFEADLARLVEQELSLVRARRRKAVAVVSSDKLLGVANIGSADGSRFRPDADPAVDQVIRTMGSPRTTVVVYTRRQDRLLELCYAREVLSGGRHSFGEQFPRAEDGWFDYVELIDRIGSVSGVGGVVVRPYEMFAEAPAAFADHLLGVAGLAGRLDLSGVRSLRSRPTCSARGLQIALRMNAHLESSEERARAKDFVLTRFPADGELDARFLDDDVRARILAAHSATNNELFRRFMPALPVAGYASDEGTAELGRLAPTVGGLQLRGAVRRGVRSARRLAGGLRRRVFA